MLSHFMSLVQYQDATCALIENRFDIIALFSCLFHCHVFAINIDVSIFWYTISDVVILVFCKFVYLVIGILYVAQ